VPGLRVALKKEVDHTPAAGAFQKMAEQADRVEEIMRKLTLLVALTLTLTGCAYEPVFEGRPASYWRAQLKHPDHTARWRAALALGRLGPQQAKPAIPDLIACLNDSDHAVRFEACGVLGRIGPDAREAVPTLKKLQNDPVAGIRRAAETALQQIDPEARAAQTGGT
jgi:hypothetical protein